MITIKFIPNILSEEGRLDKQLEYNRDKTIQEYLVEAGFDHKDKNIVVSGKKIENLNLRIDNDDEILIIPKIEAPAAVVAIVGAVIGAGGAIAGSTFLMVVGAILSIGASIYSAVTAGHRQPSFDINIGGGSKSTFDADSATYGWNIRTIQEVGTPIALIYGEHKFGGNIINSWVYADGDKNYLNLLIGLCEGEIESISGIKINDNPIANFTGITNHVRLGTNNQDIIPNFEDLHNTYNLSVKLTQNSAYTYTTTDSDVEGFEVHFQLPSGLFMQNEKDGSILTWDVTYKVEYRTNPSGSWIDLGSTTISAKSRTNIRRVFRKDGLAAGKYDIRVTRTSVDGDFYHTGDFYIEFIDEIKTDDLIYPNTALLGLKLLATDQLSGDVPNVTCIIKGKKVRVPQIMYNGQEVAWADYYWDSATSQFKRFSDNAVCTWDGSTYVDRWSANPIWCLRDLMTNARYGLGEFIDTSLIDDVTALAMAKHCEERIPDGNGGYEKRYRLDVVIDSQSKALDLLIQLCATFRALPFYSGGTIKMIIDKPTEPSQLFGEGNVIANSVSQSWKSSAEVPNVIEVQYLDKDKDYKQERIAVVDEAALAAGEPMRKKQVRIFVTRTSYAIREGRFALWYAKYINRAIEFKAGIDAIAVQSGDIFSFSSDIMQIGFSGRVQAGSTTTKVKLDRSVTIEASKSYKIRVRLANDTVEEKTISDPAGTYTEVNVSSAFSQAPQAFDVYSFGESNKVKKDFRLLSLQRENSNEVKLLGIEYDANVYDESAVVLPTTNYSALSTTIPNVTNLSLTEGIIKLPDGTIEDLIDVWFERPSLVSYYVKQYAKAKIYLSDNAGSSWICRGEAVDIHYRIQGGLSDGKTYKVAVVSVDELGRENSISNSPQATLTIQGKSLPPNDVTGFGIAFATDHLEFTWNENSDVDLWGYEIRELPYSGASWSLGMIVATKIGGKSYSLLNFTTGVKYYAIKAIDTSGNYSANQATASITISNIPDINIVATFEASDFLLWTLSGETELCMMKSYNNNYYRWGVSLRSLRRWGVDSLDSGNFFSDKPIIGSTGVMISPVKDLGAVFDASVSLEIGIANVQGGIMQVEVAYSDTDPAPVNWTNFASGSYTGRYFRFRITVSSNDANYGVDIYKFKATFDVPDKEQQGVNISIAGTGWTTINLNGFTAIKALIVMARGAAYIVKTDESGVPSNFKVQLYDTASVQQAGAVNYYVKGY